ncbi:MAG: bifunctional folylpolyglutamate synthase/dihydrofolate synthase [Lachnospiraceae bacterium]|nr:bifunctional folylpolyglutamate synthase/dihydrofolate synthase [Lachnospiraceae bacterium]
MSSYITDAVKTYEAAEQYILGIPKFTKKNSMENTRCFLKHLGYVDDRKVKSIHVAGTNGKGSVCAYLYSILKEAGFQTGMFISPHLVSMRERFLINGEMVSEEAFLWAFQTVAEKLCDLPEVLRKASYHPTFFEYLFFMAVVLFGHYGVEYIIWETGLGGRLDATNAIDRKDVCVITSIGYDHMEYLGETLPEIAAEKAGIFRKNVPVVYFDKEKSVTETLEKCAVLAETFTFPVSFQAIKEINSHDKTIDFSLQSNYYGYIRFRVPTIALYQVENAVLAVAAVEQLADRTRISKEQLAEGIRKMRWEGRMEEIMPSVYLDGAHNTDGIRAFLKTAGQDGCAGRRFLLFSMVQEKQYREVMDMLAGAELFDEIGVVAIQDKRALPLQELADYFRQYTELRIREYGNLEDAMQDVCRRSGAGKRVYIVGSLYLAGEVKALLRRHSHD